MLLLSTKTNNKIVRTDERTDGRVVCKIVFSITFNVSFWCSKEPSHHEDSFEHQKCLSENIKVDLRIISKLTSKLNIKKAGQGPPAGEMPFEWHFVGRQMWVRHRVLAGFTCHDLQSENIDNTLFGYCVGV